MAPGMQSSRVGKRSPTDGRRRACFVVATSGLVATRARHGSGAQAKPRLGLCPLLTLPPHRRKRTECSHRRCARDTPPSDLPPASNSLPLHGDCAPVRQVAVSAWQVQRTLSPKRMALCANRHAGDRSVISEMPVHGMPTACRHGHRIETQASEHGRLHSACHAARALVKRCRCEERQSQRMGAARRHRGITLSAPAMAGCSRTSGGQ